MILHELVGQTEDHPAYQDLANSNRARQYGFLKAAVEAALAVDRRLLGNVPTDVETGPVSAAP